HRFVDPDASYQVALAKTVGRLVMRAAEAEVAPYTYAPVAARVAADVENLHELAKNTAEADKGQIKLVEARAYALADDPTKRWRPPTPKPAPKDLDFAALDAAAKTLKASAESFDAAAAKAGSQTPAQRAKVNAALIGMEQTLLDPDGLPGRPWYRHLVSAPGMLTGYGAKTLPGVREAIEARRWDEAQVYIGRTAKTLDAYSARLDQARALLSPTV
ncbi:MAG: transferrin receptor-like dimerization domain-containing protein, partial [Caulobacteraceae bacterium]